jgi:CDP-paratose 2-epimerase
MYGGRQFATYDQGWVGWFCMQALQTAHKPDGHTFTISGNGKQVRDVLYIDDLLAAYRSFFEKAKQLGAKVYTIGGGKQNSLSVIECLDYLRKKFGYTGKISYHPWRTVDQKIYISDISKASLELGWKPQISPFKGIDKLVEWTIENRAIFTN